MQVSSPALVCSTAAREMRLQACTPGKREMLQAFKAFLHKSNGAWEVPYNEVEGTGNGGEITPT